MLHYEYNIAPTDMGIRVRSPAGGLRYKSQYLLRERFERTLRELETYGFMIISDDTIRQAYGSYWLTTSGADRTLQNTRKDEDAIDYWHQDGSSDLVALAKIEGSTTDIPQTCVGRSSVVIPRIADIIQAASVEIGTGHSFPTKLYRADLSKTRSYELMEECEDKDIVMEGVDPRNKNHMDVLEQYLVSSYNYLVRFEAGLDNLESTLESLDMVVWAVQDVLGEDFREKFYKECVEGLKDQIYIHKWSLGDTMLIHDSGEFVHVRWPFEGDDMDQPLHHTAFEKLPRRTVNKL